MKQVHFFRIITIFMSFFEQKFDPMWLTDERCALFVCGSFDFHWLKYLIGNRFFLSNFVPKCTPILRSKNHWSLMCRKFKAVITLLHTTYLSSRTFLRNDIIISKIHIIYKLWGSNFNLLLVRSKKKKLYSLHQPGPNPIVSSTMYNMSRSF